MAPTWQTYLCVEWALAGLCFVVIGTRLTVRPWKIMWSFWLSEVFLILGLLTFMVLVVGDTYAFTKNRAGFDNYGTAEFQRWLFAADIIFDLSLYLPRFSLLAFYNELFPITEQSLRRCLYAVMVYTICAFLGIFLGDLLWCGPDIPQNWLYNTDCSLLSPSAKNNLYINWSIGITTEVCVFALPFGMLRRLKKTPRREKFGMIGIFTINILSIITSTARFTNSALRLNTTNTYLLGSGEIATQIIAVALPALRPLLKVAKRLPGYLDSRMGTTLFSDKSRGGSSSTGPSTRESNALSRIDNSYDIPDINDI